MRLLCCLLLLLLSMTGCAVGEPQAASEGHGVPTEPLTDVPEGHAAAVFAGGCFWCMEKPFDLLEGVVSTTSGYTAGPERAPTYRQVASGQTGHTEALRVVYDPSRITYAQLLETFWRNIDPTQAGGQFCDRGSQYRSGIYTSDPEERRLAEESLERVRARFDLPIHTELGPASDFWAAEDYHQDYYRKNPARYAMYRRGCGRDARLEQLWGDEASH